MFVKVIAKVFVSEKSLLLNNKDDYFDTLNHFDMYVNLQNVVAVKVYTSYSDGIDWDIGGIVVDAIFFDLGFCKDDTHSMSRLEYEIEKNNKRIHGNNTNIVCNCNFDNVVPLYVLLTNSKENGKIFYYIVDPSENDKVSQFMNSSRESGNCNHKKRKE